jgi:hypothetical protein
MKILNTFIVAEIIHKFEQSTNFDFILRKVYELENFKYVIEKGIELTTITRKEFKELEANYVDFITRNARHTS